MNFYAPFCIPFIVGAALMFLVVAWKWLLWIVRLPKSDKLLILRGLPTVRTLQAVWEVVRESLLHRRIFRVNPLLGYMHMSLAFGWFLLILSCCMASGLAMLNEAWVIPGFTMGSPAFLAVAGIGAGQGRCFLTPGADTSFSFR